MRPNSVQFNMPGTNGGNSGGGILGAVAGKITEGFGAAGAARNRLAEAKERANIDIESFFEKEAFKHASQNALEDNRTARDIYGHKTKKELSLENAKERHTYLTEKAGYDPEDILSIPEAGGWQLQRRGNVGNKRGNTGANIPNGGNPSSTPHTFVPVIPPTKNNPPTKFKVGPNNPAPFSVTGNPNANTNPTTTPSLTPTPTTNPNPTPKNKTKAPKKDTAADIFGALNEVSDLHERAQAGGASEEELDDIRGHASGLADLHDLLARNEATSARNKAHKQALKEDPNAVKPKIAPAVVPGGKVKQSTSQAERDRIRVGLDETFDSVQKSWNKYPRNNDGVDRRTDTQFGDNVTEVRGDTDNDNTPDIIEKAGDATVHGSLSDPDNIGKKPRP